MLQQGIKRFILAAVALILLFGVFWSSHNTRNQKKKDVTSNTLKIGTYNVWNFNNDWEIRFKGIAELIREESPDIIGLQELRIDRRYHGKNQFAILRELLPEYPYGHFQEAMTHADSVDEGIAVLSRYPIVDTAHRLLSFHEADNDQNTRAVLNAVVATPQGLISFFVTHLSYVGEIQCRQAFDVLMFCDERGLTNYSINKLPKIVAGDFNTYINYEYPMKQFTDPVDDADDPCFEWTDVPVASFGFGKYVDAWSALHPNDPGLTFYTTAEGASNCRPDRILFNSNCLTAQTSHITAGESAIRWLNSPFRRFLESLSLVEIFFVVLLIWLFTYLFDAPCGLIVLSLYVVYLLPSFVSAYLSVQSKLQLSDHKAVFATFLASNCAT